ncbi:MAG: hypothetical protein IJR68_05775, partial [Fretibacterium sp.]|nr:hypothetical protein [Fretibacterium sp.]
INLKDPELREDYTSFKDETEETRMRFKALSTDYILEQGRKDGIAIGEERGRKDGIAIGEERGRKDGIAIGEERARHSIMERLIAGGISPQQAAAFTGLSV